MLFSAELPSNAFVVHYGKFACCLQRAENKLKPYVATQDTMFAMREYLPNYPKQVLRKQISEVVQWTQEFLSICEDVKKALQGMAECGTEKDKEWMFLWHYGEIMCFVNIMETAWGHRQRFLELWKTKFGGPDWELTPREDSELWKQNGTFVESINEWKQTQEYTHLYFCINRTASSFAPQIPADL